MDIKFISNRVKELCKERNWSYYRLAIKADFYQSTITSIIQCENMPNLYTLDKICKAFGITMSEFFQDAAQSNTQEATSNESFYRLWEELPDSDKQKVLIYMYGLLHKPIEGETLNDL